MSDLLPLLLWAFAVLWSLGVSVICLIRARLLAHPFDRRRAPSGGVPSGQTDAGTSRRQPEVEPVSWNVVAAQALSVLFAGVPFVLYRVYRDVIGTAMRVFYERFMAVGVIVVLVLIAVEWSLMYVQAHRAHRTQIDRTLRR